ncbi:hypothetical protein CerSpe_264440 [Prunus speciosa]
MSYTGGEAHAVDINLETVFDDLKFKLAEMLNLEYKSISMKYFLPGNTRTLITLSNDKDLKRMYEFHGKSVTADVFVMGKAGFDSEALSTQRRACGIKLAESVTPVAASTTSATALHSSPLTAPTDVKSAVGSTTTNAIPVVPAPLPLSKQTGSVMSVEERTKSPSGVDAPSSIPSDPVTVTADANVHSSNEFDTNDTPADTVKKRRRTAAWKIGVDGPTIVAVTDHVGEKRKVLGSCSHPRECY